MSTSLAEINDRVYLELEVVGEYLSVDKIHNAVIQRHNVRVAQSRMSSVNVMLGVSASFTPTETTHDVSALIGSGVPAWLETYSDDDTWVPVRIVSLVQLSGYAQLNVLAAAFYATEADSDTTEAVQYVDFSVLPGAACRIRFDRDRVRTNLVENAQLPDSVIELIVKEAQNMIIPRLKVAIDVRCRKDKELREIARDLKQSLTEMQMQNTLEINRDLIPLWMVWAFKDRANESGFTKPTPSSRGMYI